MGSGRSPLTVTTLPLPCFTRFGYDDTLQHTDLILAGQPDGRPEAFPHPLSRLTGKRHPFCAADGPCASYELADRRLTSAVFCGKNEAALRLLREALRTMYYNVSLSGDVMGVACAAAMKNAWALTVCMAAPTSPGRSLKPKGFIYLGRPGINLFVFLLYASQSARPSYFFSSIGTPDTYTSSKVMSSGL